MYMIGSNLNWNQITRQMWALCFEFICKTIGSFLIRVVDNLGKWYFIWTSDLYNVILKYVYVLLWSVDLCVAITAYQLNVQEGYSKEACNAYNYTNLWNDLC